MPKSKTTKPLIIGAYPTMVKTTSEKDAVYGVEDWLERSVWVEVISSNIKAIAYDAQTRTLAVEFDGHGKRSDAVYEYQGVPEDVARDMFLASSMGVYLDQRIKKAGYSFRGPL